MSDLDEVRALAEPYWQTRANDIHVPESFELAQRLLESHPEADADVVLPAIRAPSISWRRVISGSQPTGAPARPLRWSSSGTRR